MKRFSILLVDDEERILNFVKTKLKSLGFEVLLAGNGVEALEQIQGQEPDLVVLDVIMPKMDGFQTLKELRTFSAVPVIDAQRQGRRSIELKGWVWERMITCRNLLIRTNLSPELKR